MVKIQNSYCLIQAFRHLLCEERERHGLTQFELAKKSGLSRQCISLLESGQRIPTLFSLLGLARGFNVPLIKLLSSFMNKLEFYEQHEQTALAADSKKARWYIS
jgi:transcriptional regulator with XRE-family HTH domain